FPVPLDLLTDHERLYYTCVINECAWGPRRRAQECAPYRHTVVGRAVLCTPSPETIQGVPNRYGRCSMSYKTVHGKEHRAAMFPPAFQRAERLNKRARPTETGSKKEPAAPWGLPEPMCRYQPSVA